ncbi:hypothetical protein VOM14_10195 [Paraburkholderia sp. MPAMCS5]|uniref:hypothetical protein n=1 Tax=Paraburkholderia sp. MPAMCS5 TaxID=3112563 RepID=UPI002E17A6DE|nr:hypothetical protein [Paraburkholderia sp. MPAMCS5]
MDQRLDVGAAETRKASKVSMQQRVVLLLTLAAIAIAFFEGLQASQFVEHELLSTEYF